MHGTCTLLPSQHSQLNTGCGLRWDRQNLQGPKFCRQNSCWRRQHWQCGGLVFLKELNSLLLFEVRLACAMLWSNLLPYG